MAVLGNMIGRRGSIPEALTHSLNRHYYVYILKVLTNAVMMSVKAEWMG
jgi:hypothetical protein